VSTVRKAVILAAGLGTRMLPATKAIPKEMLPVLDKPLIQYAVEEAVAAGIEQVVFVVSDDKDAIRRHFAEGTRAETFAHQSQNEAMIRAVCGPSSLARFEYVVQHEARGIAHAISCARGLLEGDPFVLMFPDDLILGARPCVAQLVGGYEQTGGTVIAVQPVANADIPQYGIIDPESQDDALMRLRGVVEKPEADDAPSNLGIVGRYVLSPSIFSHIERTKPGKNGELQITDAILGQISAGEPTFGLRYEGTRFDTGRPLGYLVANVAAALLRDDLRDPLLERLAGIISEPAWR
jgi:UTP--glucose-1-phosphate uridylyltransferase